MLKHQLFPMPPSVTRRGAVLPAASDRLPTPRIGARDGRSFLPEGSKQVAELSETAAKSLPETRPATGRANAIWQSVLWFFLEGFALYGASLHWVATTAVTAIASEVDARQRQQPARNERWISVSIVSPAREVDRYRFVHPGWPVVIWRAIASRWAKWLRERQIKAAVAALAEYDDRTLRDMGILDRSQIEQTVRYGRDC